MNIEEERKAFEQSVVPAGVINVVRWTGEGYEFKDGGRCMTQDYFDVWLKAKAHAEEMAKPHCRVTKDGHDWWLYRFGEILSGPYKSAEEAKEWAKAAGYRVIE